MSRMLSFYVIVRADGEARVVKRRGAALSRVRLDEILIPMDVVFPDGWGQVLEIQRMKITAPDPPTVTARVS